MIALILRSAAATCIIPMQDWLGLDNSARINQPSTCLLYTSMTQSKNDYFPRCQMSRSYSAMVRSEENIPALAMFTRHLRRQPFGSQA